MSISISLQKKRSMTRTVDMLKGAGVISDAQARQITAMAHQTRQPVEKALVSFQFVSPELMQAAMKLQLLNSESMLPTSTAMKALSLIDKTGVSVNEALISIGWGCTTSTSRSANELGLFLKDARIIDAKTYESVLRRSKQELCGFATYLLLKSVVSCQILNAALQALSLVMQGKMTRSKALAMLKFVYDTGVSVWDALSVNGISDDLILSCQLSLGELLTQSGLLTELDRAALVEHAIAENKLLGDLLISQGFTNHRVLQAALVLQKLAREGVLSRSEACLVLRVVNEEGADLKTVLTCRFARGEMYLTAAALKLLISAELVIQTQVLEAGHYADSYGLDVLRGLVLNRSVTPAVMEHARDLAMRLRLGVQDGDEAISAIRICAFERVSLEQALDFVRTASGELRYENKTQVNLPAISVKSSESKLYSKTNKLKWVLALLQNALKGFCQAA